MSLNKLAGQRQFAAQLELQQKNNFMHHICTTSTTYAPTTPRMHTSTTYAPTAPHMHNQPSPQTHQQT
jgi:hypothetical protein